MKNCYTFLILFFCLSSLFSQEKKRFELTGTIISDSIPIANVHIINKTTLKGTITNSQGTFTLPVHIGDTLHISHINFDVKKQPISLAEKITKHLTVHLYGKTHSLNEITLKKRKSLLYIDPQIMPHSKVKTSYLKLPYAKKALPENKNVLRPETGLAVNLVSLINTFNGKRKKAKELKNAKRKDQKFDKLRNTFHDSFYYVDLNIRQGHINQFLEFCIQEGIYSYREKDNIIKLTNYLIQKSKKYPHKQLDNDSLLTKH